MATSKIPMNVSSYIKALKLGSTVDLNTITTPGYYSYTYGSEGTVTNGPTNSVFTMIVLEKNADLGVNQLLIDNRADMYFRVQWSTGWQAWRKVTTTTVT